MKILQDAARTNPHTVCSVVDTSVFHRTPTSQKHPLSSRDVCSLVDLSHMSDQLSEFDWRELTDLITAAPPERVRLAVSRVNASCAPGTPLITPVDRLLHLATISSGDAFDRALLGELRRLSIH
jgi:hypothetical protein